MCLSRFHSPFQKVTFGLGISHVIENYHIYTYSESNMSAFVFLYDSCMDYKVHFRHFILFCFRKRHTQAQKHTKKQQLKTKIYTNGKKICVIYGDGSKLIKLLLSGSLGSEVEVLIWEPNKLWQVCIYRC